MSIKLINLNRIKELKLETHPYQWKLIDNIFAPEKMAALVDSFPCDNFKTIVGYDGEKGYEYEARSLVPMGVNTIAYHDKLSPTWRELAQILISVDYRSAMSQLVKVDLMSVPMEVNVFHYGQGAWLGPHIDLKDKIITHVFYFNRAWKNSDGGCLAILNSNDMSDVVEEIPPIIGNSSVIVRSEKSWHAVSRVSNDCRYSRRSMTVTFYHPNSISTMWPPGDMTPLHNYYGIESKADIFKAKIKAIGQIFKQKQ